MIDVTDAHVQSLEKRILSLEQAVLHLLKADPDSVLTSEDYEGWVRTSMREGRKRLDPIWRERESEAARKGACAVIKGRSRVPGTPGNMYDASEERTK
jgi:hypothetical protein